jgi:hypothetical protein
MAVFVWSGSDINCTDTPSHVRLLLIDWEASRLGLWDPMCAADADVRLPRIVSELLKLAPLKAKRWGRMERGYGRQTKAEYDCVARAVNFFNDVWLQDRWQWDEVFPDGSGKGRRRSSGGEQKKRKKKSSSSSAGGGSE